LTQVRSLWRSDGSDVSRRGCCTLLLQAERSRHKPRRGLTLSWSYSNQPSSFSPNCRWTSQKIQRSVIGCRARHRGASRRTPARPCRAAAGPGWADRTPLDNSSGKRSGSAAHKKGNRYIAAITGETAVAAGKTHTREGARYRRIARRRGKNKACVALGNTQLRVLHALLSHPGSRYCDLGPATTNASATTTARSASSSASSAPSATKSPSAASPNPNPAQQAPRPPDPGRHPHPAPLRPPGQVPDRLLQDTARPGPAALGKPAPPIRARTIHRATARQRFPAAQARSGPGGPCSRSVIVLVGRNLSRALPASASPETLDRPGRPADRNYREPGKESQASPAVVLTPDCHAQAPAEDRICWTCRHEAR
jgi:hypothetical protein